MSRHKELQVSASARKEIRRSHGEITWRLRKGDFKENSFFEAFNLSTEV